MSAPFRRGAQLPDRRDQAHTTDPSGRLVVRIFHADHGYSPTPGCKSRSILVEPATVADVSAAIERALFGEPDRLAAALETFLDLCPRVDEADPIGPALREACQQARAALGRP